MCVGRFPCLLLDVFGPNSVMLSMFSGVLFSLPTAVFVMLLDTLLYLYDVECMSPCVLFSLPFSVTPNGFRKIYGMLRVARARHKMLCAYLLMCLIHSNAFFLHVLPCSTYLFRLHLVPLLSIFFSV
jgi:hypothetical protein